jgi:hypothetical protein
MQVAGRDGPGGRRDDAQGSQDPAGHQPAEREGKHGHDGEQDGAGTAALLAVAAVLALPAGASLRRSAGAVTAVIAAIILPYLLATAGVLPAGAADWLLRVTPAAGFTIQQSLPQYPQVSGRYTPFNGYFPLAPWAGFAVLCGWAALALGLAVFLLRRRDA